MGKIDLYGAEIVYRRWGSGEPVVLLHSSAGSSAQWTALGEALQGDFQALAPDLYGYGETKSWPGRHAFSLADEAEIVETLVRIHGGQAHLVGHSYGGAVALKVAARGSVSVRSLTLIEPVAFHVLSNGDPLGEAYLEQVSDIAEFVRSSLSMGDRTAAMHAFVNYWNGHGAWESLSAGQRDKIIAAADKVPLDFWAVMSETATLADYLSLTTPTLLVSGTESPAPVRRIVSLLDVAFRDVRLSVIPGAGHMLPLTHAAEVNKDIAAHLRRHRPVRAPAAA
jgi:pimeloyl-ACP methyl ester carboxylesterase